MKNFDKNFENFKRRKPKPRFGDKLDYTGMRFVDSATKELILTEYSLIKEKKSKLSSKERGIITKLVEE